MTYFTHYTSQKCLSSYKKYFIFHEHKPFFTTYKTKFFISKKKYIPILYCNGIDSKFRIKIKYAILFMNFIIKKAKNEKFFCLDKYISADYSEYFEYILTNNMIDHLEIFLKKYYPIVESCYRSYGLSSIFTKKYNMLPNETLSYVTDSFSIFTLSSCIETGIVNEITYPILKNLLKLFVKKLKKCLTSEPSYFIDKYHIKSSKILTDMHLTNLHEILQTCVQQNNTEFFKYALDKLSSLFDNIDADEIKNKILYDSLYEYFEYDKEIKEDLIRTIVFEECEYCPEIYEMVLSDLDVEYLKNKVILLVIKKVGHFINVNYYIEPVLHHIYSKTGLDQKFIDDLFLVSENGSENLIKILVEYGADYEKYGTKLIKKAKKRSNYHVINYVKKLLKNNDK
ncbi:hypothetical protein ma876 [Moumouvirus australiensis]|uniref:Ankyrin repeat protein n=1 Tax=Moumouvirus australiensis TaxID=2109587 RepID=A0A2P1EN11_9VIRU|nr:hypothetical protein QKC55_gp028 [Moumouvirus australiensis]AVL95263.1 hypothetical protein ma876 [Moumouvirus australiensis]